MEKHDLKDFIEKFVIPDMRKMIEHELHYYAFAIICQGIEVLGSVYDQKNLDEHGLSEARFDNAIKNLFRDKRYREKKALFYSVLRGPLIHQLRPGKGLFISSAKKDQIDPKNHLEKHAESGNAILVIEQFLADFADAFEKFKKELVARKDLHRAKVDEPFVCVSTISPPYPTNWWDDPKQALMTITPSVTGQWGPPPKTSTY